MNRSAYLTTGLAIKTLSSLSRADIVLHGHENLPKGPIIFVINHFTRVETLLLPYYIYNLTSNPVCSLADAGLFKGGLRRFFDMVGVISTKDPQRDRLIMQGLLTGETDWIIYPEGRMVKTKKTVSKGKFMVFSAGGSHKPHTGAASLALRAEVFRRHLLANERRFPYEVQCFLDRLSISSIDKLKEKSTSIVPVNLTYYPIRARENIASVLASRLVKDLPDRMMEEIMTEGTMLLSGVDLDIRFGNAIRVADYLNEQEIEKALESPPSEGLDTPGRLTEFFRRQAAVIMERYMEEIYNMTTINHEHLFASFLRFYPKKKMEEADLNRRVFQAICRISGTGGLGFAMHRSLTTDQMHLLTDDRFGKYRSFLDLALEKGVLRREGGLLIKERSHLSELMNFHRGRIDNPVEVIANEVEPLKKLQRLIVSLAWQPDFLVRLGVVRSLLRRERALYGQDLAKQQAGDAEGMKSCAPFLLPGFRTTVGVVLVHSYLAGPDQVRRLARALSRKGIWVYCPRLAGHGTRPEDLADRKYDQWLESVETGYAIISTLCRKVVLGGMAVGGCLALELAARAKKCDGVFAVCPPSALRDFSTKFMPTTDVWNRIMSRFRKDAPEDRFIELSADPLSMSYRRNPVYGIMEVGRLLDDLRANLELVRQPALILQASDNPVVDPRGSRQLFDRLGAKEKRFCQIEGAGHIIVNGEQAPAVHRMIVNFIRGL